MMNSVKASLLTLVFLLAVTFMMARPALAQPRERALNIVTSFYPLYVMARNVAGGVPGVSVVNLTSPATGCLHDYAVTVSDLKKLAHADIFFINGAGLEVFISKVAGQFPGLNIVTLSEGLSLISDGSGQVPNPHVWVSVSGAIGEVEKLAAALEAIDPARAGNYRQNAEEYVKKLRELRQEMMANLAPFAGRKIVTFHEAFPYFARDFGFEIVGVVEREPGSEPSARELAITVDRIKNFKASAIFTEPQYPSGSAAAIGRETGVGVYSLDPAVSGPDDPDAYLRIMRKNVEVLKNAFAPATS